MEKIEIITKKLILIESAWRSYFFSSNFLLSKINYNKIENSNYFTVIIEYLKDTIPFLKTQEESDENSSIFYSIGLLQTIYVQQDLVKELFGIFNLEIDEEGEQNRKLRNKLIGHPISRKGKKLEMVSLFGYSTDNKNLNYLQYSKNENFKSEIFKMKIEDIIESHFQFLENKFEKILGKINEVFNEYLKILEKMLLEIDSIEFEKLIIEIEDKFNYFFRQNIIFEQKNILKCFKLQNLHSRYKYNLDYFSKDFKSYLIQSINNINEDYLNNINVIKTCCAFRN